MCTSENLKTIKTIAEIKRSGLKVQLKGLKNGWIKK